MFYETVQLLGIGNGPFYRLKFLIYTVNWLLISSEVHWIWNAIHNHPPFAPSLAHTTLYLLPPKKFSVRNFQHSNICDDEWAQFSHTVTRTQRKFIVYFYRLCPDGKWMVFYAIKFYAAHAATVYSESNWFLITTPCLKWESNINNLCVFNVRIYARWTFWYAQKCEFSMKLFFL